MLPTRRDLHFQLAPDSLADWHLRGPYLTQFANAMSISFPEGERFFIHAVRQFRERIEDPQLQRAVTAFIGQEALHSREHEAYNRGLQQAGLPAQALEDHAARMAAWAREWLPAELLLAITVAQEHCTAIVAELLLNEPRLIEGACPRLRALWHWHALEEIEHKAVAFDVYTQVMGRGARAWALRSAAQLATTTGFLALVLYYQQRLLAAQPRARTWRNRASFVDFMLRSPGLLPRLAGPWLDYFRPRFHPWDHDNRHLLARIEEVLAVLRPTLVRAA